MLMIVVDEAKEICKKNDVEFGKLAKYHFLNIPQKVGTFLMGMEKMIQLNFNGYLKNF